MQFVEREFIPVLFGNDINVYSVARVNYTTGDYVVLEHHIKTPEEALLLAKYEMTSSHHNEIIIVFPGCSIELSDDELKLVSKLAYKYRNKEKKTHSLATKLKNDIEKIKEVVYNVFG